MTSSDLTARTCLYWHGVFYDIERRTKGPAGDDLLTLRRVRHLDCGYVSPAVEVPVEAVLMLGRAGLMAFVRSIPRGPSTSPVVSGPRAPTGGCPGRRRTARAEAAVAA